MALTETILLDVSQAQRQIDSLEAELRRLSQPVDIPVDINVDQGADSIRREIGQADNAVEALNSELAETDRELRRIDDSAGRAAREIDDVGRRGTLAFSGLTASIVGFGGALVAAVGVGAFVRGANAAIQAASDLEESLSKTNVVFGRFSGNIETFASTGPQALGLSTQAALEATATFGNLFTALGLTQNAAAELSPEIVQLAADLASFNNVSVEDAILALRSGLVGEAEPLRRFGIAINETVVQAKALELGLGGVGGELTEAAKIQARYALILEQTANAQGDFARTADGIANRQRTLNAEFQNFQAQIGQALLPAFESILAVAPQVITALEGLVPVFQDIATSSANAIGDGSALVDGVQILANIPGTIGIISSAFQGIGNAIQGTFAAFGNFDEIGRNLDEAAEDFDRIGQTFAERRLFTGFADDLQAGVDPAEALREALEGLADVDADPTRFRQLSTSLIQMANLSPAGLNQVISQLRILGPALDFTADEVATLNSIWLTLNETLLVSPREQDIGIGRGLDLAGPLVSQVGEVEAAFGELQEIVDLDRIQFEGSADAFAQRFADELTGSFAEAFQTAEGDIETDAKTFTDNLIADIEEQLLFEQNLQRLRDAGGELLAGFLEAEGPEEAAGLLADFLANPAEIARAEQAAREQAAAAAAAEIETFTATLEAADFSGIGIPPIEVPLTFGGFVGDIPTVAFTAGGIEGGGIRGGGNVTVNINNPTTNNVTSDANTAAQIIGANIRANRTGGTVGGIG